MLNDMHMFCSFKNHISDEQVLRNMKSFTAMKLIDAIINNQYESKREQMLDDFEKEGTKSCSNNKFKFWEREMILFKFLILIVSIKQD